ncbi:MAG TPA: adenosine deaminase [Candidatus Limnocylindria bacterium]|nr:adenosine deaminase [Candidatus Limnocylindria bacterium]
MGSTDRRTGAAVGDLFQRMPKAELHLHLDGSLRPATALELARQRGLNEGMDLAAMAARLRAPAKCRDQAELLAAFDLPIAIMQDAEALYRIAFEMVEDVASDGTRYAEIKWGPLLHVMGGLELADGIAAVAAGTRDAAAATGVVARLVAVALRSHPPDANAVMARTAAEFVDQGLTGFDFAGQEAAYPDPLPHVRAFDIAREAGLGITIHGGEWGGAAQVRRTLEAVNPARIAHGATAAEDPGLMAELVARKVTLDICPTSNVQADDFDTLADVPLPALLAAGVPVTLNTDDRTVSDLTLPREYTNAHEVIGISVADLWRMNMHALRVAFLHHDESERARLIGEFEAFAASEELISQSD